MVFLNIVRLFSIYFGHIGSLFLSDGWAIVLSVLVLLGFAVIAYRSRGAFDDESTSHGADFPSYWMLDSSCESGNCSFNRLAPSSHGTSPDPCCILSPKKEGRSMKSAMYFKETQALMQTFSQEDQVYFQDLWDYFNFAGFLYEEKALREQVYNLAVDFSQASGDGLTAKDYFGQDPKGWQTKSSRTCLKNLRGLF